MTTSDRGLKGWYKDRIRKSTNIKTPSKSSTKIVVKPLFYDNLQTLMLNSWTEV